MKTRIVEYRHELAAAVADMWNHSREGWGGSNDISTAESVRQQEENSINLNTYLALDGSRVAGYCGLSEYREDSGALYIPLLNVREEYQGKKIGKQLVQYAVERTVELGWPRLDLYTWGGNTKAVPLYKKCGFFWEDRDDTVHLMNFIPTVLATEAVKQFFETADWYHDRKMEIEVKPDGRKENGFDFYEYRWDKNGQQLRMEFERKGRGLRLIETKQYLIYALTEQQELIFGSEYPVYYHIHNKTTEPLLVSIEGFNDQNIRFECNEELTVTESAVVEGRFFVGEITEEQNSWRTHPTVAAKVKINGKEAVFKLGINCKFPARLAAKLPKGLSFLETDSELYLEMENYFNENVEFSFRLPEAPFIDFETTFVQVRLAAKERKLLPIAYRLTDYGFYQVQLEIEAKKQTGESILFKKELGLAFSGIGAKLTGECEEYWHVYNGLAHAYLSKFDNRLYFGRAGSTEDEPFYFYPKLGKPFSSEFSKKRPDRVEFTENKEAVMLRAVYNSQSYPDLQLYSIAKVYAEGLMEHHYEVYNLGSDATNQEIWLNDSNTFNNTLYESVLPYNGKLVEINELKDGMVDYWQSDKVDENWIFSRTPSLPGGFCWSSEANVQFLHWFLFFEHNLGVIPAKGMATTPPTYTSFGAFPTWEAFRAFALGKRKINPAAIVQTVQFFPDQHNPFVGEQTEVHYRDNKFSFLEGELSVLSEHGQVQKQSFSEADGKNEAVFPINLKGSPGMQIVHLDADLTLASSRHRTLLIPVGDQEIRKAEYDVDGVSVFEADNGLAKIKAAPSFFPALYSLVYDGKEWLDTSFPAPKPKAWWNPWAGGIRNALLKISSNSLIKEQRSAEFAAVTDNRENQWQGIKLRVELLQHETFKGLSFHQYFLLLPGAPVMCTTTEIINCTNLYFNNETWYSQAAFKHGLTAQKNGWIEANGKRTYFGAGEMEHDVKQSFVIGHPSLQEKLQVITDYQAVKSDLYMNKEVAHHTVYSSLNLNHGETFWTAPTFYLFNEQPIPEEALGDLKSIRFN